MSRLSQYQDAEPIGIYFVGIGCSMAILDIINGIEDYVVVRGFTGDLHKYKIHIDTERPYFRYCNGCRYHLDEFVRV